MGNSVVTTLKIALEKDEQNPGFHSAATKKLKGTVYLYIAWKTDFQQLEIRLLGHEYAHVDCKKRYDENRKFRGKPAKHRLINEAITLTQAGTFERGKYEFPFEINLPAGLPASACGGKLGSNIRNVKLGMKTSPGSWYCGYKLEARLHRPGMLTWDVSDEKTVRLYDEPKATIYNPVYIDPDHHTVRQFGCCKLGYMTLAGQLTSNNIAPGDETFEVHYAISNESTCTIKAIQITIKEHVKYSNENDDDKYSRIVLRKRIDAADIGPGNEITPKTRRDLQTAVAPIDTLLACLNDPTNGVQTIIPSDVMCSWIGHLIEVTHTLEIKALTDFWVSNPKIKFDICIHGNGNPYQAARVSFTNGQSRTNIDGVSVLADEVRYSSLDEPSVTALPEDWKENLTIATPVIMAIPHPTIGNYEDNEINNEAWPNDIDIISPSAPPMLVNSTTEGLLGDMRNAVDEISVLRNWTTGHGQIHMITEQIFGEIFANLKSPHSYIEACEILGSALGTISVNYILHAARKVQPNTNVAIVGTCTCLARYCNDRENVHLLRELDMLSEFMVEVVIRSFDS